MPATVEELRDRLDRCMSKDVRRFRNRLRGGKGRRRSMKKGERHKPQPLSESVLAKIEADIERSVQQRLERERRIPTPTYPEDLPVVQRKDDL